TKVARQVLIALEAFDPLSNSILSEGLKVSAKGLNRDAVVNLSRRFVWLRKRPAGAPDTWPEEISIDPGMLPFESETIKTPAPADIDNVPADQRLVRIVLRPTGAADFAVGVTAVRGQLFETSKADAAAVTDARVQLAWQDSSKKWTPAPPATDRDAGT